MRISDWSSDVCSSDLVLSLEFDRLDLDDSSRLKHDVAAMRRLIDQRMLLAQIDAASAAQFPLESVSLVEIARDVGSLLAPGIIAEGKAITLDAGSGHPVARGRREAIAAALRNLIENAVRVTPTGSTVTLRVGPAPVIAVRSEEH